MEEAKRVVHEGHEAQQRGPAWPEADELRVLRGQTALKVEADPGAHGFIFPGSAFLSHDEESGGYLIFTVKSVAVTAGFSSVTGASLLSRRKPVFGEGLGTVIVRVAGL